jgi:hypothetical protein
MTFASGAKCWMLAMLFVSSACDVLGPGNGHVDFVEVVAGEIHACALADTGVAYCWGAQDEVAHPPRMVSGSQRFLDLTATPVTSVGEKNYRTADGSVIVQAGVWGVTRERISAYWGRESWEAGGVPTVIEEAAFESIIAGGVFGIVPDGRANGGPGPGYVLTTCGLTAQGEIHCYGDNQYGQLGRGSEAIVSDDFEPVASSVRFANLPNGSLDGLHLCALSLEQQVYCWGLNTKGQLGGTSPDRCAGLSLIPNMPEASCSRSPILVAAGGRFVDIAVGRDYTCALDPAGTIHCWGGNGWGQLGRGFVSPGEAMGPVSDSHRFASVSAGGRHVCATGEDGRGYCWGDNEFGQLGDGTTNDASVPREVAGGHRFTSISAGPGVFSCGTTVAMRVLCWGRGFHGQLGNGSREPSLVPVPILEPA